MRAAFETPWDGTTVEGRAAEGIGARLTGAGRSSAKPRRSGRPHCFTPGEVRLNLFMEELRRALKPICPEMIFPAMSRRFAWDCDQSWQTRRAALLAHACLWLSQLTGYLSVTRSISVIKGIYCEPFPLGIGAGGKAIRFRCSAMTLWRALRVWRIEQHPKIFLIDYSHNGRPRNGARDQSQPGGWFYEENQLR
jgi:hypothetical protein